MKEIYLQSTFIKRGHYTCNECFCNLRPQLPPHGCWKPSLNISSCLTSLQVLMSEPNPDDPLMPEIADELRYQRDKVTSRQMGGHQHDKHLLAVQHHCGGVDSHTRSSGKGKSAES